MSQENVETVKGVVDAFNRQDWDTAFKDAAHAVLNGRGRGSGIEVRMEGWQVWLAHPWGKGRSLRGVLDPQRSP